MIGAQNMFVFSDASDDWTIGLSDYDGSVNIFFQPDCVLSCCRRANNLKAFDTVMCDCDTPCVFWVMSV